MKYMKKLLPVFMLLLLTLCACESGGGSEARISELEASLADAQAEIDSLREEAVSGMGEYACLPEALRAMVNFAKDDLLSSMEEAAALDALALRELHFGGFSSSDANELLALFTIQGSPHAAGTDRTVVLLVDMDEFKPKAQTTVTGDAVALCLFKGADGRAYPFFLTCGAWQGLTRYTPLLLEAASDGWAEKEIHESLTTMLGDPERILSYAVTGGSKLHVFEVDESGFPPVQPTERYLYTLEWDAYAACFVLSEETADAE